MPRPKGSKNKPKGNNTPNGSLTWEQAALSVLRDAGEQLHYTEISDRIMQQSLTRTAGATPTTQANVALQSLVRDHRMNRVSPGVYALPEIAEKTEREAEAEAEAVASPLHDRLAVEAYGLHWHRDDVNWNMQEPRLWGDSGGSPIDFADQDAIYLLHFGNEIAYVGQTKSRSGNAGLYNRLKSHHTERRKTVRWDTFSWFGFRPVRDNGQLGSSPAKAEITEVIDVIEAILIEGVMPRLNMRRGEGIRRWEGNQYFPFNPNRGSRP